MYMCVVFIAHETAGVSCDRFSFVNGSAWSTFRFAPVTSTDIALTVHARNIIYSNGAEDISLAAIKIEGPIECQPLLTNYLSDLSKTPSR